MGLARHNDNLYKWLSDLSVTHLKIRFDAVFINTHVLYRMAQGLNSLVGAILIAMNFIDVLRGLNNFIENVFKFTSNIQKKHFCGIHSVDNYKNR